MKKSEGVTLLQVSELIKRVPNLRSVVTDTDAYRVACRDYEYVNNALVRFIENWVSYLMWKNEPEDEVDTDYLEDCKSESVRAFEELKNYINERAAEGWE